MDLTTGLAAASQSLTILKQIKELDTSIDASAFKVKLLELQEKAHDARAALLEAKEAILAKDEEIADLTRKLQAATSGAICPACGIGNLRKSATRLPRMNTMARMGVQEWVMNCDNSECSHEEINLHDPNGILAK